MSEWKPGDVADVVNEYGVRNRAICAVRAGHRGLVWSYGVADSWTPVKGSDARPVVVIDPEDAEQVERIGAVCYDAIDSGEDLQSALREFAAPTPPKPDEPQGLYSRVTDAQGRVWVRTALQASVWRPESVNTNGLRYLIPEDTPCGYSEIPAIRVLSEGVS